MVSLPISAVSLICFLLFSSFKVNIPIFKKYQKQDYTQQCYNNANINFVRFCHCHRQYASLLCRRVLDSFSVRSSFQQAINNTKNENIQLPLTPKFVPITHNTNPYNADKAKRPIKSNLYALFTADSETHAINTTPIASLPKKIAEDTINVKNRTHKNTHVLCWPSFINQFTVAIIKENKIAKKLSIAILTPICRSCRNKIHRLKTQAQFAKKHAPIMIPISLDVFAGMLNSKPSMPFL